MVNIPKDDVWVKGKAHEYSNGWCLMTDKAYEYSKGWCLDDGQS